MLKCGTHVPSKIRKEQGTANLLFQFKSMKLEPVIGIG